uniref:Uncharacterized protein n=1 Tax=Rhizobium phage LG08 TaxID=3129229 RepID=A0AAU8HY06_9CAUD
MHKKSVNVLENMPYYDFYSGHILISRTTFAGYDPTRAILMAMIECARLEKEYKREAHCVVHPNGAFRYCDPKVTINAEVISVSTVNLGVKKTVSLKPSDFPFKKIKFSPPRVRAYLNSKAVEILGVKPGTDWEIRNGKLDLSDKLWSKQVYVSGKNAELLGFNDDNASFEFVRASRWKIKDNGVLEALHGINLNNENERFDFPVLTII